MTTKTPSQIALLPGEKAMPDAPIVPLNDNCGCIPQHYLEYAHTLESVESIVLDIQFDDNFPLFVSEDHSGMYLQVGVIGIDNYLPEATQQDDKIVYGRRWRVESQLPTSEIIQTAFLAFQKAREHEVRERFRFHSNGKTTTPFNTHHDLPLMAQDPTRFALQSEHTSHDIPNQLNYYLSMVTYDRCNIEFKQAERRANGQWIIDLTIKPSKHSSLPELVGNTSQTSITLLMPQICLNSLLHALMDTFLTWSNQYVEQHFTFQGFARFSRNNSVAAISELSYLTRQREAGNSIDSFTHIFANSNYETDKTRVPVLSDTPLSRKLRAQLAKSKVKRGILPL